jgi:tRNA (cytidine/uridine-2'-O-)-methyltransferase
MIKIALIEPEIPQNTGNIGRVCVGGGCGLILAGKLGYSMDDKQMKRAGLDYWYKVDLQRLETVEEFFAEYDTPEYTLAFMSKKAEKVYTDIPADKDRKLVLVFGKETKGLSEEILTKYSDKCYRIPTTGDVRSLNIANAVSIVTFDILRRRGFEGLEKKACL